MNPTPILTNVYTLGFKTGQFLSSLFHPTGAEETTTSCVWWNRLPPMEQVVENVANFPLWYKDWWLNLYRNDPVHVFVETTLLAAIVYFLVMRRFSKDWREVNKEKLTKFEEEELLKEWKEHGRKPLTPQPPNQTQRQPLMSIQENNVSMLMDNQESPMIVVHKNNGRYMVLEINDDGVQKQVLNFASFDFLGMQADYLPRTVDDDDNEDTTTTSTTSTKQKSNNNNKDNNRRGPTRTNNNDIPDSPTSTMITEHHHPVKEASLAALDRYGCGSCGPRGFYGTLDVHLALEKKIAEFTGTDDAILYSDGASTVSSTIAAFCKRGDVLVVDEAVYEPIRTGCQLSRANIKWFAHNDMDDLRRVLTEIQQEDKRVGRKLNAQRRFLVVEGLYKNTGSICPLDKLVPLKHEFKYRLILDESFSFGTLGKTGRGAIELYEKKLMYDAEIVVVSLENCMGSIGAMTIGTEEVVDHQRLSGSGYCFSAASPPFTATAAIAALDLLEKKPELTLRRLHQNCAYLHKQLTLMLHEKLEDLLTITGDDKSPIILLQVADIPETEYLDEVVFFQEVVRESLGRGVAFVATGESQRPSDPPTGIRMTVSAIHNKTDIDMAVQVLGEAVDVVMHRFYEEEEED